MTKAPCAAPDKAPGALTEADLGRLIDSFKASGCRALDLRHRDTHLRLALPSAAPASATPGGAEGQIIKVSSPGVGTFQAVQDWVAGTAVTADTLLGHLRSLEREREVLAGRDGVITAQVVSDGAFVAYGASLFELTEDTA